MFKKLSVTATQNFLTFEDKSMSEKSWIYRSRLRSQTSSSKSETLHDCYDMIFTCLIFLYIWRLKPLKFPENVAPSTSSASAVRFSLQRQKCKKTILQLQESNCGHVFLQLSLTDRTANARRKTQHTTANANQNAQMNCECKSNQNAWMNCGCSCKSKRERSIGWKQNLENCTRFVEWHTRVPQRAVGWHTRV